MNELKIIKSRIFNKFLELKFGISTLSGGDGNSPYLFNLSFLVGDNAENVKKNRKIFFDKLGISENQVSYQRQIHSIKSNRVEQFAFYRDSDALYTNRKNNFLAVSIADCIPVFLFEKKKKIVAAIHSGWKGTLNRITTLTIEKIITEFAADVKNILAYIGPGIPVEHFEVGREIADLFDDNVTVEKGGKFL